MKDESILLAELQAADHDIGNLIYARTNKVMHKELQRQRENYNEAEMSGSDIRIDGLPDMRDDDRIEKVA